MQILITAGNTQVLIDRVRCLTNIFTGRTGAAIARHAHALGHQVTLLTSHPEVTDDLLHAPGWRVEPYRTFHDLTTALESHVPHGGYDAIVHCAAVSDYLAGGVFAPATGTVFDPAQTRWHGDTMIDRAAGKVKSDEPELWIRLVRAPKLIDRMREEWGFRGVLVKFKLEVDRTEPQLRDIAERSRQQSHADWMVANTLDGATEWAILGNDAGYERIDRRELPSRLLLAITRTHEGRS